MPWSRRDSSSSLSGQKKNTEFRECEKVGILGVLVERNALRAGFVCLVEGFKEGLRIYRCMY